MIENISIKLKQGKYSEAEEICNEMDMSETRETLMNIVYETEAINVYGFIVHMARKQNDIEWIKLAIDILINPLCFLEGAYSMALFHTRELLSMDRNVNNLEKILFFYNIPEKLIDKEEAYHIAEEILSIAPDNKVALHIINNSE